MSEPAIHLALVVDMGSGSSADTCARHTSALRMMLSHLLVMITLIARILLSCTSAGTVGCDEVLSRHLHAQTCSLSMALQLLNGAGVYIPITCKRLHSCTPWCIG